MLALMQQPGEMTAIADSEAFNDGDLACLSEIDIPVAVRKTAARRWSAKIQHRGREHTFTLHAKSKEAAVTEVGFLYDTIRSAGWDAALLIQSLRARRGEYPASDENINYWKGRLASRRYPFPPAGSSDKNWSVRLDHVGAGYWFPLATENREMAAEKARRIFQTVFEQGWDAVFNQHARELVLSFEWCSSPVLWTYTTIHTLVGPQEFEVSAGRQEAAAYRVIVVEADEGIRRALQWCVNQQSGFKYVSCAAPEALARLCSVHQPSLVLLNRNLAGSFGVELSGELTSLQPGVMVVGYSVSADGDQMFASLPGGVEGYMLKRVRAANLLEPVLGAVRRPNESREDLVSAVKYYFKELLHARPEAGAGFLPRLTPRENDVLKLLSTGCSDREIARALGISFWTVHDHLKKIFRRLDVRTRTEAVARYWGGSWGMPAPADIHNA